MTRNSEAPSVSTERPQSRSERFQEILRSRRAGIVAVVLLIGVVVIVLVSGPSPDVSTESASTTFAPAQYAVSQNNSIKLPDFDHLAPETELKQVRAPSTLNRTTAPIARLAGPQLLRRPRDLSVVPGTLAKAILLTGASNGPVKAALTEALRVNGEELLEANTVLLGSGQSSDERLFIRFDRVVFKDGSMQAIQADAADSSDKIPGIKGSKVGYQAVRLAGSIGLNFIAGMSDGLQEKEVHGKVAVNKNTAKNALLNGASYAAIDQSREMMSSLKSDQPIFEVSEGTVFYLLFGNEGN